MIKLIKIGAVWCGPCRVFDPVIKAFNEESSCLVESVDIDEHPEIGQKYNVKTVPTVIWINVENEEVLEKSTGVKTLEWLRHKHQELKGNL
jgi:thioredoxin 1